MPLGAHCSYGRSACRAEDDQFADGHSCRGDTTRGEWRVHASCTGARNVLRPRMHRPSSLRNGCELVCVSLRLQVLEASRENARFLYPVLGLVPLPKNAPQQEADGATETNSENALVEVS